MLIGWIVCAVLSFIIIGIFLAGVLFLFGITCVIIASIKTINGDPWHYPLTLQLIK